MPAERISVAPVILHENSYYATAIRLLSPGRILEIGCANGRIGQVIRTRRPDVNLVGLDIERPMLEAAPAGVYEELVEWDLNAGVPPINGALDGVLALDVLEHVVEPRMVLRSLTPLLRERGTIIIGVPNWLHYANRMRILRGRWRYDPAGGLYDATHLRFFSYSNVDQLVPEELHLNRVISFPWMPGGAHLATKPFLLEVYRVLYQTIHLPLVHRFPRLLSISLLLEVSVP